MSVSEAVACTADGGALRSKNGEVEGYKKLNARW